MSVGSYFHAVRSFLRAELQNIEEIDIPWRRRLWLYRHGFLTSKEPLWTLTPDTVETYLSDIQGLDSKIRGVDSPYDTCLEDKILFPLIVSRTHPELLPEMYGVIKDDTVTSIGYMDEIQGFDDLIAFLADEPLVAKPPDTAQGDGVRILDTKGEHFTMNDQVLTRDELITALQDARDLVLQEYVSQADYAAEIYPDSVNTIRIITMVDPETDRPFIAAAMHRFGTAASEIIDNASSGGITAGIDVGTGTLGEALVPHEDGGSRWAWRETHPDTGTRIAGTEIPRWEHVTSQLLDLARAYGPLWPLAAWDVVFPEGEDTITVIEGNANVGTKFIQAHQPLLEDQRVRRFFEYHSVL